jgi:hypothetical protein
VVVALDGTELATSTHRYRHGQITTANTEALQTLNLELPGDEYALQDPRSWLESSSKVMAEAVAEAEAALPAGGQCPESDCTDTLVLAACEDATAALPCWQCTN